MTKHELVDHILLINHSAEPEFLLRFEDGDLQAYLEHLQAAFIRPRPCSHEAQLTDRQPAPGSLAVATIDQPVPPILQKWSVPMESPQRAYPADDGRLF